MQIQAVKRAQRLRNIGNRSEKRVLIHGEGKRTVSRQKKTDRTTRLLIAILFFISANLIAKLRSLALF